jgi:hypothetical protein
MLSLKEYYKNILIKSLLNEVRNDPELEVTTQEEPQKSSGHEYPVEFSDSANNYQSLSWHYGLINSENTPQIFRLLFTETQWYQYLQLLHELWLFMKNPSYVHSGGHEETHGQLVHNINTLLYQVLGMDPSNPSQITLGSLIGPNHYMSNIILKMPPTGAYDADQNAWVWFFHDPTDPNMPFFGLVLDCDILFDHSGSNQHSPWKFTYYTQGNDVATIVSRGRGNNKHWNRWFNYWFRNVDVEDASTPDILDTGMSNPDIQQFNDTINWYRA